MTWSHISLSLPLVSGCQFHSLSPYSRKYVLDSVLQRNRNRNKRMEIYVCVCICVCVCIYIWRFIIRTWLAWLWRLASPKICWVSQQNGGQWFSSTLNASKCLRIRRTNGVVPVQRPIVSKSGRAKASVQVWRQEKKPMPRFEGSQAGRILSYSEKGQPFCYIQAFN